MKIFYLILGCFFASIAVSILHTQYQLNKKQNDNRANKRTLKTSVRQHLKNSNKNTSDLYKGNYTSDLLIPKDFKKTMDKSGTTYKLKSMRLHSIRKRDS